MKNPYFVFTIKNPPVTEPISTGVLTMAIPVRLCNPAIYDYCPFASNYYPIGTEVGEDTSIGFTRLFTLHFIRHFFRTIGFVLFNKNGIIGQIHLSYELWSYKNTGPYVEYELLDDDAIEAAIQKNPASYSFVSFMDLQRRFLEYLIFPTLNKNSEVIENLSIMNKMRDRYHLTREQFNDPDTRFDYFKTFLMALLMIYIRTGTTDSSAVKPDLTLGYEPFTFNLDPESDWIERASNVKRDQNFTILKESFQPKSNYGYEDTTVLIRKNKESEVVVGTARIHQGEIDTIKPIENLIIDSNYRNQGYGTELIKYCVNPFGANILFVDKDNTIAIHMYALQGFFVIDSRDKPQNYYVMRRFNA